jgi:hypothetical protein
MAVNTVRTRIEYSSKRGQKKQKQTCPECGKDIHDPDCAYSDKSGA